MSLASARAKRHSVSPMTTGTPSSKRRVRRCGRGMRASALPRQRRHAARAERRQARFASGQSPRWPANGRDRQACSSARPRRGLRGDRRCAGGGPHDGGDRRNRCGDEAVRRRRPTSRGRAARRRRPAGGDDVAQVGEVGRIAHAARAMRWPIRARSWAVTSRSAQMGRPTGDLAGGAGSRATALRGARRRRGEAGRRSRADRSTSVWRSPSASTAPPPLALLLQRVVDEDRGARRCAR